MVRVLSISVNWFLKNRILQHILFWGLSFLILVNMLKVSVEVKRIDLIYSAVFHLPILVVVYTNLRFLVPWLLEKRKYLLYAVAVLLLVALGSGFYLALFNKWIDYIFEGYYFIAYYGFWDISLFFVIYLFATGLLHLARGWFRLQEIENERNKAELRALRMQINPHFLFNSLNSIYSLARRNSDEVPEKIVQLSNLLRHAIYDSEQEFVPLEKEVEMIRNYIALQNLRANPEHQILMQLKGEVQGKQIAPMIILPFVENSFKHGLKGGAENAFVAISLEVSPQKLLLDIENSKGKGVDETTAESTGIGIENVRKRLELIYPDKFLLKIREKAETFEVHLQIEF